jgi:hypothetical protein
MRKLGWTTGIAALFLGGVIGTMADGQQQAQPPAHAGAQTSTDLGYTDTPILPGLPYRVHDPARPHPKVVTPGAQPGDPPSDAIVLFDGKDLSKWTATAVAKGTGRWVSQGMPAPWKVEDGYLEVVPKAGAIATRDSFGDVQLHVEWAAPSPPRGKGQDRGNSGIFLMGLFETQVLDSYENPTYADGQAGAIYGQWPPLVNATRKPGEWQAYDIVFEAPRFEGDKLVTPAFVTVFLNGILLHNRKEEMGPTQHRQLAKYASGMPADGPIVLQDHNHAVRYRNVWLRKLAGYDVPEK